MLNSSHFKKGQSGSPKNQFKEGHKHPRWKGGKYHIKDKDGYVCIRVSNHPHLPKFKYVREHRLVMEKHLGRYLTPAERIHHINGIKSDNRIENLLLCSTNKAQRDFHSKMERFMFSLIQTGIVYYDKEKEEFLITEVK